MKLLVIGPYNSGKSTFIRRICRGSSMSIDKSGTTVALDHGITEVYGVRVYLFGTPGLARFEVLRKILSKGADAVIMIVDSVNKGSFEEARELYSAFRDYLPKNTPLLIATNKQDIEGAISPDEVKKELNFPEEEIVAVLGTSVVTGDGVEKILSLAVLSYLSRYSKILHAIRDGGSEGIEGITKRMPKIPIKELKALLLWLSWRGLILGDWNENTFSLPRRIKEITDILDFAKSSRKGE